MIVKIPLDVFQVQLEGHSITIPVEVNLRKDGISLETFVPHRYIQVELVLVETKVRLVIRNYVKDGDKPQVIDLFSFADHWEKESNAEQPAGGASG